MPTFGYDAKDSNGENVSGHLSAGSARDAAKQLQARGLFPLHITEVKPPPAEESLTPSFSANVLDPVFFPVRSQALSMFFSAFAALLSAGINLREATALLSERATAGLLRKAARAMSEAAGRGERISRVARRHPASFSSFAVAMLEVGETSGMLEDVMRQLSGYYQRIYELETLYRSETFYLKILIVAGLLLPTAPLVVTAGVQGWVHVLALRLLPVIMGLPLLWYGGRLLMRLERPRRWLDRLKLALPVIGRVVEKVAVANWCRAMIMLYKAGVPLHAAVEYAGAASGNYAIAAATKRLATKVQQGQPISQVMAESRLFPDLAVNMMVTGELSGNIEESLAKVAEYYEAEAHIAVKQSATVVRLFGTLLIAALIGAYIIHFYTNYFNNLFKMSDEWMDPDSLQDAPQQLDKILKGLE